MATSVCTAAIRNVADNSLAYVRIAPGVGKSILGYAPVGVGGYTVLEAQLDDNGLPWLRLEFTGGMSGWVSGERIDIVGECSTVGFGKIDQPTQASTLHLGGGTPTPTPAPAPTPAPSDSAERVRKASFNITTGFEGATYNTYVVNADAGVISYGRFGFTLTSGDLYSVINRYVSLTSGMIAAQLRNQYLDRVKSKDSKLRTDTTFRDLLKTAASDPIMRQAQDEVATENYWNLVQDLSIKPRNLVLPLSQAFLFDTAINQGARHDMITLAEDSFHVPQKSRVGENGITEQQLIAKVAEIRRDRLYKIADKYNYQGLKPRGDFWVNIIAAGDWGLLGDANGSVLIKSGRIIQVLNP